MAICDSVESCGKLAEQLLSGDMTAILGFGLLLLILGVPVLWRFWSRRAKPEAEKPKPPQSSGGGNQITIGTMSGGKAVGGDDHSFSLHSPQNGVVNTGTNTVIHNHQGFGGAEVDQIVQTLLQHHQNERQADQETIKSLRAAVEALSRAADQPDATPEIRDALEQLKAGDQKAAEAIFAQILVEEQARGQRANKKAAEAARHLGALAFLHDTETALAHYRKATDLDPDDPEGWNQLGRLLMRIGELDRAIEAYERVLSIGVVLQDRECIAIATGNLGLIYGTRGDLDQAEDMHKRALAINEEIGRKEGMAIQLGNLGLIYLTRGDLGQAEEMHKRALAIEEELGRKEGMASELGNLGQLRKEHGDLAEACDYWRRALALYTLIGAKPMMERMRSWLEEAGEEP